MCGRGILYTHTHIRAHTHTHTFTHWENGPKLKAPTNFTYINIHTYLVDVINSNKQASTTLFSLILFIPPKTEFSMYKKYYLTATSNIFSTNNPHKNVFFTNRLKSLHKEITTGLLIMYSSFETQT